MLDIPQNKCMSFCAQLEFRSRLLGMFSGIIYRSTDGEAETQKEFENLEVINEVKAGKLIDEVCVQF